MLTRHYDFDYEEDDDDDDDDDDWLSNLQELRKMGKKFKETYFENNSSAFL